MLKKTHKKYKISYTCIPKVQWYFINWWFNNIVHNKKKYTALTYHTAKLASLHVPAIQYDLIYIELEPNSYMFHNNIDMFKKTHIGMVCDVRQCKRSSNICYAGAFRKKEELRNISIPATDYTCNSQTKQICLNKALLIQEEPLIMSSDRMRFPL